MDSWPGSGHECAPEPDFMSAKRASARNGYSFTVIAEHENLLGRDGAKEKWREDYGYQGLLVNIFAPPAWRVHNAQQPSLRVHQGASGSYEPLNCEQDKLKKDFGFMDFL